MTSESAKYLKAHSTTSGLPPRRIQSAYNQGHMKKERESQVMRGDRVGGTKAIENAEIERVLTSEYIMPEIIKAAS